MHNGVMVIIGSFYQPIVGLFQQFLFFSLTPIKWILFSLGVNSTKISQFLGKKMPNFH
jgi:hypothetical protein